MKASEALYLFYLSEAGCAEDVQPAGAGPASRMFVHRYAGLAALLEVVSLDDFRGPEAERRLSDLGWVGERALRHERVIEQGLRNGPLLPARFGTLFSSVEALERLVRRNRKAIGGFLAGVRGQDEWAIKAYLARQTAIAWLGAQGSREALAGNATSPGLRYVHERRARAAAEKELQQWLRDSCETVANSLDTYATDRRQRPIHDRAIGGDSNEIVLNLAVLVPRARRESLFAQLQRINEQRAGQGLSFAVSGPWPPYSFCPPLTMRP